MIPRFYIESWRANAPWQNLNMVEQDLVISRALVNLYNQPLIRKTLAFRGGTALNKLFINPPTRFSEDIDLVQIEAAPIGETLSEIRKALDNWLGEPRRKLTERSVKLTYRYEGIGNQPSKLKIEINTTEHFHVQPLQRYKYTVTSDWFKGETEILTYCIDELLGTKLRALYQRNKGRDLFDLWYVVEKGLVNINEVIKIFHQYNEHNKEVITRAMFEKSLFEKEQRHSFLSDMTVLFPSDINWEPKEAIQLVYDKVIAHLKGEPWKNPLKEKEKA